MSQKESQEIHGAQEGISGTRLLDREIPEGYRRQQTSDVAAPKEQVEAGTTSIVIFRTATEWLALSTKVIQGVDDCAPAHTMPNHRSGILNGLVNIRGELLLSISLSAVLQLEKASEVKGNGKSVSRGRLLICNRQGNRFAFPVDEICGVHRYHPKDLRDIPSTLARAAAGNYIIGVLRFGDKTIGCIDDELLFYAVQKGLA